MPETRPTIYRFDGTPLRVARLDLGLSQAEVAARGGSSQPAVALAELSVQRPAPETLARLCDVVGITLDDVFVPDDVA